MAIGIYLGGTTGAADGTLEVPGDGTGLTLGAVGSVGTIHIRAASGKRNAEQVTVNAPTDCQVSADGTTYGATAVYAIGAIQDVNVAVYVKRTAGTTALTTGGTTTPRLALITEEAIPVPDTTAPVLSGTLVATAGDGQVTLSGPTATDAVGIAKWQYRIGDGAWVDIAGSNNTTMPSTVVGSLTNGTEYSFTVRALDAADNASDASGAATATPEAAVTHIDDFDGPTLDTDLWTAYTAGGATVSVADGTLIIDSDSATTDAAVVWMNATRAFSHTASATYIVKAKVTTAGGSIIALMDTNEAHDIYSSGDDPYGLPAKTTNNALAVNTHIRLALSCVDDGGSLKFRALRGVVYNSSGEDAGRFWNGSAWQEAAYNLGTVSYDTYYYFGITTDATGYRLRVSTSADLSSPIIDTGATSATQSAWAKVRTFSSTNSLICLMTDAYTTAVASAVTYDYYDEV